MNTLQKPHLKFQIIMKYLDPYKTKVIIRKKTEEDCLEVFTNIVFNTGLPCKTHPHTCIYLLIYLIIYLKKHMCMSLCVHGCVCAYAMVHVQNLCYHSLYQGFEYQEKLFLWPGWRPNILTFLKYKRVNSTVWSIT